MTPAHWLLIAWVSIRLIYIIAVINSFFFLFGFGPIVQTLIIPLCTFGAWCLDQHIEYVLDKHNITKASQLL